MKALETNDWMLLNSIIYQIYTVEDASEMRRLFLERLKGIIDFDSADFCLQETDGFLKPEQKNSGQKNSEQIVTYNCSGNGLCQYAALDYSRGIICSRQSMVYRETDLLSDEKRINTEYYQKVYLPNNWHYSVRMILCYQKEVLGIVDLYRTAGKENFTYEDLFLLDLLKEHVAFRLYQDKFQNHKKEMEQYTVEEIVKKYELTRREEMVLAALSDCKSNEQISEEFGISVNTLKKHILNIYRKVGVNNRVQLYGIMRNF